MFKSEKKNNTQKLVPEIMHLIMCPDNELILQEDFFFYSELCGHLQVLPLDDRNWLRRAHMYTPTHIYLYMLA